MTVTDYKILFEVRVLHDYYLYESDQDHRTGTSFFAMDEAAQGRRLQELLRSGRYDIRNELGFVPGWGEQQLFNDLRLRVLYTATGFYVAMEVKAPRAAGEDRFRPVITPDSDTRLAFALTFLNPAFGAISNLSLGQPDKNAPDIYFFTNDDNRDAALSAPVGDLVSGQAYEMGDLARLDNAVLGQATQDNAGDLGKWIPLAGAGVVHQGDRRLSRKVANLARAYEARSFEELSQSPEYQSLSADDKWFLKWLPTVPRLPNPMAGVIRISLKNGNGTQSPLDADGLLATHYAPGNPRPARPVHPIFELRFLSRATYWRYRKVGKFTQEEIEAINENAGSFLDQEGDEFVTKGPKQLARELPPLEPPGSVLARIPNPQPGALRAAGGRVFSDVYFNDVISKPS